MRPFQPQPQTSTQQINEPIHSHNNLQGNFAWNPTGNPAEPILNLT